MDDVTVAQPPAMDTTTRAPDAWIVNGRRDFHRNEPAPAFVVGAGHIMPATQVWFLANIVLFVFIINKLRSTLLKRVFPFGQKSPAVQRIKIHHERRTKTDRAKVDDIVSPCLPKRRKWPIAGYVALP